MNSSPHARGAARSATSEVAARRLGFLRRRSRGQSIVEFALILPVMLILLAAAIDLGRLFYSYVAVENAAKEGAFFGARNPLCDDDTNPVCDDPNNVVWHVQKEAPNIGAGFTTTVACRDSTTGALIQPINNCLNGSKYQVTVTYPFQLITPILGSILGNSLTLHSEAQATVVNNAFDPSGLEVLVWVDATFGPPANGAAIASACTQADASSSPGYYYQPCQDSLNADNYLQFQENTNVRYKVRVRNTGNVNLTGISYVFTANGTTFAAPGNCGTLPTSILKAAGPSTCTFTRAAAWNPADGLYGISVTANGDAGGLSTGDTNGLAVVQVTPAPRLAINLKAATYRLGGDGDGLSGVPQYATGNITLNRNSSSSLTEIKNPVGWLYLTVVNQGGAAQNVTANVTQGGTSVLPGSCVVPTTLAAAGSPGDSFSCVFPRTVIANQTFVATANATNATIVGGTQPQVTINTGTCNGGRQPVPNLVDTLTPTADGSNKNVGQAKTTWNAGFTVPPSVTPAGAPNGNTVQTQTVLAYTCAQTDTAVTLDSAP